jgi:hypothetical protein
MKRTLCLFAAVVVATLASPGALEFQEARSGLLSIDHSSV